MPLATTISGTLRTNRFNDISGQAPNLFFIRPISQIPPVTQTYTNAGSNAVVVPYNTQFQRYPRYVDATLIGGGGGGSGGCGGVYWNGPTFTNFWGGGGGGSGGYGAYIRSIISYDFNTNISQVSINVGAGGSGGLGGIASQVSNTDPSMSGTDGKESNLFIGTTKVSVANGGLRGGMAGSPNAYTRGLAGTSSTAAATTGRLVGTIMASGSGNPGQFGKTATAINQPGFDVSYGYAGGTGGTSGNNAVINPTNRGKGGNGGTGGWSGWSGGTTTAGTAGSAGGTGLIILVWYYQ